jgi:hypothetical protein
MVLVVSQLFVAIVAVIGLVQSCFLGGWGCKGCYVRVRGRMPVLMMNSVAIASCVRRRIAETCNFNSSSVRSVKLLLVYHMHVPHATAVDL